MLIRKRREEALRKNSLTGPPYAEVHDTVSPIDQNIGTKPLAISVDTFCRVTSLGRTAAFALIRENRVEVTRVGRRTLVLMRSVEALLGLNGERD